MKHLVVYSSKSGNTKKLAEEIFRQLPEEKEFADVAHAPDPSGYDVICIGFWLKGGEPDPASQSYLKKCAGRKLFLFATHGAAKDSNAAKLGINRAMELAEGATILGSFSCQGEVPENVIKTAAEKVPKPDWVDDAPAAKGHPNKQDFMDLAEAMTKAGLKTEAPPSTKGPVVEGVHAM
jgi:flavodoxin